MMKPEIKKLWVGALRSGDYLKTKKALRDRCGFCAAGVLVDLAVKAGVLDGWMIYYDTDVTGPCYCPIYGLCTGSVAVPGPAVIRWAYGDVYDPDLQLGKIFVQNERHTSSLTCLNDIEDLSFNEIADLIEADKTL